MPWSLVEALAEAGQRRPFYLPLASGAPDFSEVGQDQYDPENDRTTDPNDPRLRIIISPPQGEQFANQGPVPDPAIRLYAIGAAWVRFRPAQASFKDSLELKLAVFASFPLGSASGGHVFPLWWGRWLDAGCIPDRVVYENVDAELLREALENVRAPIDNQFENRVLPTLGLQFPYSVTQNTKAEFIDRFMAGEQDYFMVADKGAYLGAAARADAADTDPNANRLLTLHAQYHDHAATSPHPMNPLELFNLLFGNESDEAKKHPLLLKIDAKGKLQPGHESKSMRIRPPLRTHARLMWEADFETVDSNKVGETPEAIVNAPKWEAKSNVQQRLYNDFSGTDELGLPRHFDRWTYDGCKDKTGKVTGCWKCNLLTFDVALRAGFRIMLHVLKNSTVWHYRDPNDVVKIVSAARPNSVSQQPTKVPIRIKFPNNLTTETLAWNTEGLLRRLGTSNIKDEINRQIKEEGRCFVVAGSRSGGNSGHMILVESVLNDTATHQLTLASSAGQGFLVLLVRTRSVTTFGAQRLGLRFAVNTTPGYSAIHLFELHPGKDPDTPIGLQDCNGAVYL